MGRIRLVAAVASLVLASGASFAAPALILVGLDAKTVFAPEGDRNGPGGSDALALVDVSDEAHPRLAHTLPLDNSVYGPPTNLQITPDGRLALVANSVIMRQEGERTDAPYYAQPDDRLHVIDLSASPPTLVETLRVGRQPSGLAINGAGDLALVANRAGRSVSVLAIADGKVTPVGLVDVGDEAAAVAFSPDGTRAYVAKNKAGKIGVLAIDGRNVSYDPKKDMPVGAGVYAVEVTPDASLALTANTGSSPSDGNADSVSVIATSDDPPKVIDWLGVGDTPEALDIAPDGLHAAVSVVRGASAPHASPDYTPQGLAVLLAIEPGGKVRQVGEAEAGAVTQGIAFSPSGRFVYICNYSDKNLQVYRVEDDAIIDTGVKLQLPGQPASLRGRARG